MVAQDLILNQVWEVCKKSFPAYSYVGDDLDKVIPTNDRTSTETYARRLRDCVEADEENKNLSANKLAECEAQSITLLERLLLELWYHWKTGRHLDIENVTLCAGSRVSGGLVPRVDWGDVRLFVGYCHPGYAGGSICSRSAV